VNVLPSVKNVASKSLLPDFTFASDGTLPAAVEPTCALSSDAGIESWRTPESAFTLPWILVAWVQTMIFSAVGSYWPDSADFVVKSSNPNVQPAAGLHAAVAPAGW
jgi:hypothetical protein